MSKEYLASAEEVLAEQSVSAEMGLSSAEAASRLAAVGPNKLKEEEKTPLWKRWGGLCPPIPSCLSIPWADSTPPATSRSSSMR